MQSKFELYSIVPPLTSFAGDYFASSNVSGGQILIQGTNIIVGVHVSNIFATINKPIWDSRIPDIKVADLQYVEEELNQDLQVQGEHEQKKVQQWRTCLELLRYLAAILPYNVDMIECSRELSKFSPLVLAWNTRDN